MELHIRDGLTAAQGVALQVEAHSIQNLLRDGHRSIQDIRHIAASADSVFVLASIGVERAMKLLLGLGSLRDEGRWPPPLRILGWGETLVEPRREPRGRPGRERPRCATPRLLRAASGRPSD
ncbi:hypothetical protein KIV56_05910 [Cryobacterium breve]|uniref:DUF4332 domain-containing protein n=1 Tax=Cryobacterium breve TaxID=1259258 RepID=A0ABY7NEB9_9MICO|nr:hypothetical protein [Cryobacterium breve]WBM80854.1 hypothetical protein KIV56_05910 [Cryobacterium breve]